MSVTFLTDEDEKRFVKKVNGQTPDESGNVEIEIPEGGGTGNYSELTNKPKINGVELDGEKSLEDFGISQVNEDQIAEAVDDYFAKNPIDIPNVDLTRYVKSVNGKQPDENGNVEITIPENSGEGLSDGSVKKNHIDGIEYEDVESSKLFDPATMIYQGHAETGGVGIRGGKGLDYGKYSGGDGLTDALAIIPLKGTTAITVSGLDEALSSNIFFMNEMPDPWYMMVSVMGVCRLNTLTVQRFESPKTANSFDNVDIGEISGTVTQNDDGSYSINTGDVVYQYMAFAYKADNVVEMENIQVRISGDDENVSTTRDITKMFGHGIADTEARYKLAKKPLDNMKWYVLGDSISTPHANEGITMYFDIVADRTGVSPVSIAVPATGYRIGGDSKISGQIANIPDDADIITIMAGTNDSVSDLGTLGDTETTTLYGAVRATLQAVIDAHPAVSLGVITSVPTAPDYKSYADVQKIATVVREVAASMSIPCLDLAHGSGLVSGSHFRDHIVHPNNLGHELMAKKIAPWLLTL